MLGPPVYVQNLQECLQTFHHLSFIILFELPFLGIQKFSSYFCIETQNGVYFGQATFIILLQLASILVKQMLIMCSICISEKIQWAQCEDCFKWRKLPADVCLSSRWTCSENTWDPQRYNHLFLRYIIFLLYQKGDFCYVLNASLL